jgi:hypothetical protein
LASIGTFLSIGLKLPYFTFFGSERGLRPQPVPKNMLIAMAIGALGCTALGLFPSWLYARLPFAADYHPYTVDHVVSALQLLLGTGIGFWWLLHKLDGESTVSMDTDWLYRKPLVLAIHNAVSIARQIGVGIEAFRVHALRTIVPYFENPFRLLSHLGLQPRVHRNAEGSISYDEHAYRFPIGLTILWIVICFALATLYTLFRNPPAAV